MQQARHQHCIPRPFAKEVLALGAVKQKPWPPWGVFWVCFFPPLLGGAPAGLFYRPQCPRTNGLIQPNGLFFFFNRRKKLNQPTARMAVAQFLGALTPGFFFPLPALISPFAFPADPLGPVFCT